MSRSQLPPVAFLPSRHGALHRCKQKRQQESKNTHTARQRQQNSRPPPNSSPAVPPPTAATPLLAPARLGLDRAAVVTGVSKGIGAAIARDLAARGCHVFGSVRRAADAEPLTRELTPARFTPLVFDITDADAVQRGVEIVDAALAGRTLFALINNAGMHAGIDPVARVTADTLRRQLEVNTVAPVMVTQAFLPLLGGDRTRAGVPGRVVMMSSIYGNYGVPWNVSRKRKGKEGVEEKRGVVVCFFASF